MAIAGMTLDFSRFFRRAHPDLEGRVNLDPRRIYILPTRFGFIYGLLLSAMLLGSINSGNNLGLLFTFLFGGLGVVAILHTWHNLLWLRVLPGRIEPVFAGEEARFSIRVENHRASPRYGIRLESPHSPLTAVDLEPGSAENLELRLETSRRGRLPLGRFVVSTRYPLGLLRAWSYVEMDMHCLVYPRPGRRMEATAIPDHGPNPLGDRGTGTDDFAGLRTAQAGDSPRHIYWKAVAKDQGLLTKQFGGESSQQLWLDWNSLPGLGTEERLSRLCRGILAACEEDRDFGVRLPGTEIKPHRGETHRARALSALALFGEEA